MFAYVRHTPCRLRRRFKGSSASLSLNLKFLPIRMEGRNPLFIQLSSARWLIVTCSPTSFFPTHLSIAPGGWRLSCCRASLSGAHLAATLPGRFVRSRKNCERTAHAAKGNKSRLPAMIVLGSRKTVTPAKSSIREVRNVIEPYIIVIIIRGNCGQSFSYLFACRPKLRSARPIE
jgi:hypothetical protein